MLSGSPVFTRRYTNIPLGTKNRSGQCLAGVSLGAFAIIGSAAFLASSMKMPLTAIALIAEFTRIGHDFLIPISLAIAVSIYIFYLCTEYDLQPIWRPSLVHISTPLSKFVGQHGTWTRPCPRNTLIAPHEATFSIASGGMRSASDFTGMFEEITKSGMNPICCDRSQRITLYLSTLAMGDAKTKKMMMSDVNPCDCDSPMATIWQMRFSSR